MSQQDDDLRALAKIMDFLRAVSILFVVINIYWYCYEAIKLWGVNIGVVDKILMNFHNTAGLFGSILYTKLAAVLLLAGERKMPMVLALEIKFCRMLFSSSRLSLVTAV